MSPELMLTVISGIGSVVWYLLRQKDAAQEAAIKLLFQKHDDDYRELQELKLLIAREHYVKGELDHKFDKLEGAFRDGFADLGKKFDNLGSVLLQHIQNEESKK